MPRVFDHIVEFLHNPDLKEMREVRKEEQDQQSERLVSDEVPHWVVNSVLVLLQIIYDYMRMICCLPSISYECSNKLIDIIKVSSGCDSECRNTTPRRVTWFLGPGPSSRARCGT